MNLPSAARKLFLADGTLVTKTTKLPTNCDVYVSCGEKFKDPELGLEGNLLLAKKIMPNIPFALFGLDLLTSKY